MLFAVFLGDVLGLPRWSGAVRRHADWLGLSATEGSHCPDDGHVFAFAFLHPSSVRQDFILPSARSYLLLSAHGGMHSDTAIGTEGELRQWLTDEQSPVDVRLGVSLSTGELLAAVPPVSLEQLCVAEIAGGWTISNDLRFVARLAGAELDEYGVYGLFRHGLVPAPMCLFKGVKCIPSGHLLKITPDSEAPSVEVFFHLSPQATGQTQPEIAEAKVRDILDETLSLAPPSSVVYFSGGMDSSLIAARFAAMGRRDVTLVNYAFGPQDQTGQKAVRIADHLGLRCEQIMWNPSAIPEVLARLDKDYTFPFGDSSLVPGNLLAHASLPLAEKAGMAIHGVGTGPMFAQRLALRKKLRRVHKIPDPVRRVAARTYEWFSLWKQDSELERAVGFLRRSLEPPVVEPRRAGQHAMEGIAYTMPKAVNGRLVELIQYHTGTFAAGQPSPEGLFTVTLYLQRQISAIAAGPLEARAARTFGPFTEPRMLRYAFSLSPEEKCPGGVPRGVLRDILAKSLPPDWIYLPGSGFIAPFQEIYAHPAMRASANDVVLSRDNPLLDYCNANVMREMLERLQSGQTVSIRARKFLWTFFFASVWFRQFIQ